MSEHSAFKRHRLMPDLLLVEDNPLHLRLVKSMLADIWPPNEVAEVRHARSLEQAIEEIDREPPACVLLDLVLPDADGLDSLAGVRRADPLVPIVILSSHEDAEMARAAIMGGAQDYLVKGAVSPEDLERSVAFAMGRKDHERQRVAETAGLTPWPSAQTVQADEPKPAASEDAVNQIGTAVVAADGSFIFMEPAVVEALGRSIGEVADIPIEELLHPNDLVHWNKLIAGEPDPVDIRFLHPSGHPIFVRVAATQLMPTDDNDMAMLATFTARNEIGTASTGAYVVMSDWG